MKEANERKLGERDKQSKDLPSNFLLCTLSHREGETRSDQNTFQKTKQTKTKHHKQIRLNQRQTNNLRNDGACRARCKCVCYERTTKTRSNQRTSMQQKRCGAANFRDFNCRPIMVVSGWVAQQASKHTSTSIKYGINNDLEKVANSLRWSIVWDGCVVISCSRYVSNELPIRKQNTLRARCIQTCQRKMLHATQVEPQKKYKEKRFENILDDYIFWHFNHSPSSKDSIESAKFPSSFVCRRKMKCKQQLHQKNDNKSVDRMIDDLQSTCCWACFFVRVFFLFKMTFENDRRQTHPCLFRAMSTAIVYRNDSTKNERTLLRFTFSKAL